MKFLIIFNYADRNYLIMIRINFTLNWPLKIVFIVGFSWPLHYKN